MTIKLTIPELGDSTTTGIVLSLLVEPGSKVDIGDNLLEIETDKVVMEVPTEQAGIISSFEINVGDTVEMGTEFALLSPEELSSTELKPVVQDKIFDQSKEQLVTSEEAITQLEKSINVSETTTVKHIELTIPELGDSTTTGIILSFLVEPGSKVSIGDNLLEVETDKVVMEVPSEYDGIIDNFILNVGEKVAMGDIFAKLTLTQLNKAEEDKTEQGRAEQISTTTSSKEINVVPTKKTTEKLTTNTPSNILATPEINGCSQSVSAGPSARRLARQLGIELSQIKGSGVRGRISRSDVKAFTKEKMQNPDTGINNNNVSMLQKPLPDFSTFGETRREAATRIQQVTAENMSHSCHRIPHAWIQQEIDITDLEKARKRHKDQVKSQGGSLTITAILTKLLAQVINEFPVFSAAYDENNTEFVFRDYRHIGVAVDTPRGLVVPVIKDVNTKSIVELAQDLTQVSIKARDGKLKPADMQGSVMTISNLGGLGVTGIMPVINWPEAAILGVTAAQWLPRLAQISGIPPEQGNFVPRLIMNVSLGFDHRIINGADAARFLARLKSYCEDPALLAFNL
ncbi:MAG: 2-oxo acid dehydrogenase subunit E2 [Colwellia sp.]|nr:2-oxo acid dehydrogenase subunit E2 [Colwellia sp.]